MRADQPPSSWDSAGTQAGTIAQVTQPSWSAGYYGPVKVIFDGLVAGLLLIGLSPLILFLMLLVKLTSPGPALYSQVRLGRGGRPFRIFKIRSMFHDCERHSGPRWSTSGDSRVTWLGGILRATHLDELPQLWNVLRGEMSLVGPRPERPEFTTQLERALPSYRERLRVRPGITGLAQVYLPADVDLASVRFKLSYDLCYLQNMSLWTDLRLIIATAFKMVGAHWGSSVAWALGLPRGESPAPPAPPAPRTIELEDPVHRLQTI